MAKYRPLTNSIVKQHEHYVVKGNELIQQSRDTMTLKQYKLLLYMISKVKRDDEPPVMYSIAIKDFCQVSNIDFTSGKNYDDIKEALWNIDKQYVWIKKPDSKREIRLRWFNRLLIDYGSGTIEFSFHEDIQPYLYNLYSEYTQYMLKNILPLKSKYAVALYELMKSYQNMNSIITVPIGVIKRSLNAEHYTNYKDFRRRALEPALKDINTYCDIFVKATPQSEKGSRSYNAISFFITTPTEEEEEERRERQQEELGYNWY